MPNDEEPQRGYRVNKEWAGEQITNDFIPTDQWQEIQPGQQIPAGIKINLDIATGKRYGRKIKKNEPPPTEDVAYLTSLIEAGVNVNARNAKGDSFLHRAASKGWVDCVKVLCEAKADPNLLNGRFTPIQIAIQRGHIDVVKYLANVAKVDLYRASKSGHFPLHLAAAGGKSDIVAFLIKQKKIKVDQVNRAGETALHCAAENGHLDVLKYLVEECNANVEKKNNEDQTAAEQSDLFEQEEAGGYLRNILSDRALNSLMDDLDFDEAPSKKKKKKKPAPSNKQERNNDEGSAPKTKKNKNKKKKNKKKGKGGGGGGGESNSGVPGSELPSSDSGLPVSGSGGGSGLVVSNVTPVVTKVHPEILRRQQAKAKREAEAKAEAAAEDSESAESEPEDLIGDLD